MTVPSENTPQNASFGQNPNYAVPQQPNAPAEELAHYESTASYAVVRRAPKFKAFFLLGAILGIAVGLFVGIELSSPGMINRGIYIAVCVLFTTTMSSLAAGFIATQLDRKSVAEVQSDR
ncbi:hypothetical protein [Timonella sp. A28]|uniref:hypothetical protein n=1 Tax=Timonella sp. A28 TaxID=3442640 RepID=UPI003EB8FD3B